MSDVGKAFKAKLGKPDPEKPSGLGFSSRFLIDNWKSLHREIRSGWFKDRFLYLFGEGLDELRACLDVWSFLVPPNPDRMILGRNAHGTLLVLDDANSGEGSVHVLDPYRLVYWSEADLDFVGLIGYFLPHDAIPHFLEDDLYRAWRKKHETHLEDDVILAPKTPQGLGGKFELSNFQEEPIVDYYQTTAPIYEKAFAKMGRPKPTTPSSKKRKR